MQAYQAKKTTKTFPLEIEEDLHKALKMKALMEDKSLHSMIIETLTQVVEEDGGTYRVNLNKGEVSR